MITIRRILCPTDFSDASRHALDYAVAVAKWYDARLTVLHVAPVQSIAVFGAGATLVPPIWLTPIQREQVLASMRQSVEAEVGASVRFDAAVLEGNPVQGILEQTVALPADLLVLGTHGLSGFDRLALGSVTEKVLRKATCPVLTVPPHVPDAVPVPSKLFRRILCAIDFSACSMHALTYALSLAQEASAHLTVLNVFEHLLPSDASVPPSDALRAYMASIEGDRRMRLAQAIPDSARAFCTPETRFSEGRPHQEILRIADDDKSDLIVLGVRGRGAIDRWVFGSTAQHVVRNAMCPVLTLRQE